MAPFRDGEDGTLSETLAGRTAIVTGAAGGFGRVITRALLENGASVLATDIHEPGLGALDEWLRDAGLAERCRVRTLDIGDSAACAGAVEHARDTFGAVDILVNNAGMGMGVIRADHMSNLVSIDEIDTEIWDRFVRVNFSGAWYLTKAVHPHMKARGWGRIINITTSFFTMLRGRFHPYGPIKAGFEAMSAGHAAEFEPHGITVNVVVPGGASDTPLVPPESPFDRADLIPPEVMTPPIVWLCSADADGVTGRRYVAAHWDPSLPVAEARAASEAPVAWPDLAGSPVWPGGKPDD